MPAIVLNHGQTYQYSPLESQEGSYTKKLYHLLQPANIATNNIRIPMIASTMYDCGNGNTVKPRTNICTHPWYSGPAAEGDKTPLAYIIYFSQYYIQIHTYIYKYIIFILSSYLRMLCFHRNSWSCEETRTCYRKISTHVRTGISRSRSW